MWTLFLLPLVVALLCLPVCRPVLSWMLTALMAPFLVRFKHRFSWNTPAHLVDAATLPPEVAAALGRGEEAMLSAGFEPMGIWKLDKPDGQTTLHLRVYVNRERATTGTVGCGLAYGSMQPGFTEFQTEAGKRVIRTTHQAGEPPSGEARRDVSIVPSLPRAEWLWRVHAAMLERRGVPRGDDLPATAETWTAEIEKGRARGLQELRKKRWITQPDRRGVSVFTWRQALRATRSALWPWKQRTRERGLAFERERLEELGLTDLLREAAASPESEATARATGAPQGSVTIPDDRGLSRAIATQQALTGDVRRGDPLFRGIAGQAQAARQSQYRQRTWWVMPLVIVLAITARMLLGVPMWAMMIAGAIATFAIFVALNSGRIFAAERAAADVLLRRGICPSCLYELFGLEPQRDGCLVCPECGGAWRADRVKEYVRFGRREDSPGAAEVAGTVRDATRALGFGEVFFPTVKRPVHRDDRGEICTLVPPRLRDELRVAERSGDAGVLERLKGARKTLGGRGAVLRWCLAALVVGVLVGAPGAMLWFASYRLGFWPRSSTIGLVFVVVCAMPLTLVILRSNLGMGRKRVVSTLVGKGLCPSCAGNLNGAAVESDGCVVCRCGTAWRVREAVATASPSPVVADAGAPG